MWSNYPWNLFSEAFFPCLTPNNFLLNLGLLSINPSIKKFYDHKLVKISAIDAPLISPWSLNLRTFVRSSNYTKFVDNREIQFHQKRREKYNARNSNHSWSLEILSSVTVNQALNPYSEACFRYWNRHTVSRYPYSFFARLYFKVSRVSRLSWYRLLVYPNRYTQSSTCPLEGIGFWNEPHGRAYHEKEDLSSSLSSSSLTIQSSSSSP